MEYMTCRKTLSDTSPESTELLHTISRTTWRSTLPGQTEFDYENLNRAERHVGREMASSGYVAHPAVVRQQ